MANIRRLEAPPDCARRLDDDLLVPAEFTVELDETGIPHTSVLRLDVAVDEDGRRSCRAITFEADADDDAGITIESLHDLPVAKLLLNLVAAVARVEVTTEEWMASPTKLAIPLQLAPPDVQARAQSQLQRRRRRISRQLLEEVASVYRAAVETGAPTMAVADHFSVSTSTAAKWVSRAREQELLGKTTPGRSGENKPKKANS